MWGWVERLRKFVNRITNAVLPRRTLNRIVDANISAHQADIIALNTRLASDAITIAEWQSQMREHIKNATIQQYLLGRGGQTQLSAIDTGSIGGMLSDQYRFLTDFAEQISNGELTLAKINQRSVMYISSSREAFNRALARSHGIPLDKLSTFPGKGDTQCLTNCRCWLDIEEKNTVWHVYWRMNPQAESCPDCIELNAKWNPLIVAKSVRFAHRTE